MESLGFPQFLVEGEQKGTYLASWKFLLEIARDERISPQ